MKMHTKKGTIIQCSLCGKTAPAAHWHNGFPRCSDCITPQLTDAERKKLGDEYKAANEARKAMLTPAQLRAEEQAVEIATNDYCRDFGC